ncbi:MAG: zinc-binding dehydrogenase [Halioglobus sp.]
MKAIKVIDRTPVLIDTPEPTGNGVRVKVVSSSICGSDIHMMNAGFFGDVIIGHEFAGITDDGRAVAIEPMMGCGSCGFCDSGQPVHCATAFTVLGVLSDGGMAEYVNVPAEKLIELPTGMDIRNASLVEPLAVAVHGVDRAKVREGDRVLIVGAGPIGLAAGAVLHARGIAYDISARYPHQQQAADALGGNVTAALDSQERYDVVYDLVIDAVGSAASLRSSIEHVKPRGRIALLGTFWEATELPPAFCMKEAELVPAMGYHCKSPRRSFDEARTILHTHPEIASAFITHRYPLDAVEDAFSTASNRAAGAIKVVFDIGSV